MKRIYKEVERMKKTYSGLELRICLFDEQDAVRTSQTMQDKGNGFFEGYSPGWW